MCSTINKLTGFLPLLLISGLLLATSFCQASDEIPFIRIDANNLTPLDVGLKVGRQSKKLFGDIEKRYDQYLMSSLSQLGFDDIHRNYLPALKNAIDDRYQKELEGVASAWTLVHENKLGDGYLSWDEYWVLNLLPDIGIPIDGVGFGLLGDLSRERGTIVGRNLELKSTPELRALQAITVYQYADHAIVNIGFAGIVSVMTGFNEKGLFVAHFNARSGSSLQKPSLKSRNAGKETQPHGFTLRKVLENNSDTYNATQEIARHTYATSNSTLIADQKDIQIVEYSSSGKVQVRRWDSKTRNNKKWIKPSQIAAVNCHVLSQMPEGCLDGKDTYRWQRLHSLAVFTKDKRAGTQDIAAIMLDSQNQYYEIMGEDTLQSMIFLPMTGHLYFYGAPPAVSGQMPPPSYNVYHQDILPTLQEPQDNTRYYWWIVGLLAFLAVMLWVLRRSIKQKPVRA